MLSFAEDDLIRTIGPFGAIGALISNTAVIGGSHRSIIDINTTSIDPRIMPGQCQAFLTSSRQFVWFIEKWNIVPKAENQTSFNIPLVTLENKRIYPAKVTGLNLALLGSSNLPTSVTVRWREGLIRHSNHFSSSGIISDSTIPCMRPGFGQTISSDLNRPLLSETVVTNNLGLIEATANSVPFLGTGGRLMSMAFHVDEPLAKLYDASQSQKKKKSLNSQDYEQIPTYPTYDTWVDNGGGY